MDFEASYATGRPPWDIGRPQPEVVRLAEEGRILGQVLDVGCGTGEMCFSDREPPGQGPRRVTDHEIRAAFRGPFIVSEVREARFESHLHPGGARAWLATLRRL